MLAIGATFGKAYHGGDLEGSADVGNVVSFNAARQLRQVQHFLQLSDILVRINGNGEGIGQPLEFACFLCRTLQVLESVPQSSRLFKIFPGSCLLHHGTDVLLDFLGLSLQKVTGSLDLLNICFSCDVLNAGCGAVLKVTVKAMLVISRPRVQGATAP